MAETINLLHYTGMTMTAFLLRNGTIARAYLDVVRKKTSGKGIGMVHAIHRLHPVLANKLVGCVAIIADSHIFMTALDPTFVIVFHYMAVGAGCWFIVEIGEPSGIEEGVSTHSETKSRRHPEKQGGEEKTSHPSMLKKVSHCNRLQSELIVKHSKIVTNGNKKSKFMVSIKIV